MLFINILTALCCLYVILSIIGYAVYKSESSSADTWEKGIISALTFGFNALYEEFTGQRIPAKIVDSALILTNQEALELTRRFANHPYDTPRLESYTPNANGILWCDIRAVRPTPQYSDLTYREKQEMAFNTIQTFYMEVRNTQVEIDLKIVSPTRLYFAIPLSEEGKAFLLKQHEANKQPEIYEQSFDILEETIDFAEERRDTQ